MTDGKPLRVLQAEPRMRGHGRSLPAVAFRSNVTPGHPGGLSRTAPPLRPRSTFPAKRNGGYIRLRGLRTAREGHGEWIDRRPKAHHRRRGPFDRRAPSGSRGSDGAALPGRGGHGSRSRSGDQSIEKAADGFWHRRTGGVFHRSPTDFMFGPLPLPSGPAVAGRPRIGPARLARCPAIVRRRRAVSCPERRRQMGLGGEAAGIGDLGNRRIAGSQHGGRPVQAP